MSARRALGLLAAVTLSLAACSSTTHPRVLEVHGDAASTELVVSIDSCNQHPKVEADETPTEVRLRVTADAETGDDCIDIRTVTLNVPLGDRKVIDGASGDNLEVRSRTG